MTSDKPEHPADALWQEDNYRIYYSRVVDLAVYSGLLTPDPNSEIGHFAFSRYYEEGKDLDRRLQQALREFEEQHAGLVQERRVAQDVEFTGAIEDYLKSDNEDRLRDLIRVGASYRVWPVGTSFTLTYPWDLEGRGVPVRFRNDLSLFMKRRIIEILEGCGKLRNPNLFKELGGGREA